MATENEYLAVISRVFASQDENILIGIGDDGAVLASPENSVVLSTDMAVEGDHFKREWSSLFEIGAKITAANLADIYAMGGKPTHLLVAAAIPENFSLKDIEELARGISDEAKKVKVSVVGGDLARSLVLTIAITAYGQVDTPIQRNGARVGDFIAVSSLPGASARGFKDLQNGLDTEDAKLHRRPDVDYQKISKTDHSHMHALCDVSDGLVLECERMAKASEVHIELHGKVLNTEEILHGGEDHVFLGAFSKVPDGWVTVGVVAPGSGVTLDGKEIHHKGYSHFN